jgi:hypothetical protein
MFSGSHINILICHGVIGRILYHISKVLTAECARRMRPSATLFGGTGQILALSARNKVPLLEFICISLLSDVVSA